MEAPNDPVETFNMSPRKKKKLAFLALDPPKDVNPANPSLINPRIATFLEREVEGGHELSFVPPEIYLRCDYSKDSYAKDPMKKVPALGGQVPGKRPSTPYYPVRSSKLLKKFPSLTRFVGWLFRNRVAQIDKQQLSKMQQGTANREKIDRGISIHCKIIVISIKVEAKHLHIWANLLASFATMKTWAWLIFNYYILSNQFDVKTSLPFVENEKEPQTLHLMQPKDCCSSSNGQKPNLPLKK